MTFAKKLRELREKHGWSQKKLADESGVSQVAIAHWESGDRIPGFNHVQAICLALNVDCNEFKECTYEVVDQKREPGRPPSPKSKKTK
jgi:transcriptional regulator with XRE-family HTH domain